MEDLNLDEGFTFELPKNQSNVIKVIGVGGGGSNAINHMYLQGIKGVDFVVCNTDSQALENSPVPTKIQLGIALTEGLGAGANPEVGEKAALESSEDVKKLLESNTKMVFITAGLGGGTGTGAAPIIAKMAKDQDILTVGIVTMPFQFEGKNRLNQAKVGLEAMQKSVDSLIVINNNKLRDVYGNLGFKAGFAKADEVLTTAAKGIAEVITHHYTQNIDLKDARTVLYNSGSAIMGSAVASGNQRAEQAIQKALDSPLLNDNKITGAENVLLLIVSGKEEITIDEISQINEFIQAEAGNNANIIMGIGEDESLEDGVAVTIIATGFARDQQHQITNTEPKKIIHTLEDDQTIAKVLVDNKPNLQTFEDESIDFGDEKVVHLLEDDAEEIVKASKEEEGHLLIPTSEMLKNIPVVYEEVIDKKFQAAESSEDYETLDIQSQNNSIEENFAEEKAAEITSDVEDKEDQFLLKFDFNEKEDQNFESVENIEVKDAKELIPINETDETGETIRYSLEEFMDVEFEKKKSQTAHSEMDDADMPTLVEKPQIDANIEKIPVIEETDPFMKPIDEQMRLRTEERKRKLKEYNHKFNLNKNKIDELEKVPAYKRTGIELDDTDTSIKKSSTSVLSEDDEIKLKTNNSFLHDNVD